jgi:hypothetical protein
MYAWLVKTLLIVLVALLVNFMLLYQGVSSSLFTMLKESLPFSSDFVVKASLHLCWFSRSSSRVSELQFVVRELSICCSRLCQLVCSLVAVDSYMGRDPFNDDIFVCFFCCVYYSVGLFVGFVTLLWMWHAVKESVNVRTLLIVFLLINSVAVSIAVNSAAYIATFLSI